MFEHESNEDKVVRLVRSYLAANNKDIFNPEPEEPRPQDCCGLSCNPCIFDLAHEDRVLWAKECARSIIQPSGATLHAEIFGNEILSEPSENAFSSSEYRKFEIVAITKIGKNTFLYSFKVADGRVNLPLGCHLIARVKTAEGRFWTRQFTPCGSDRHHFEVPIKIYEDGRFTQLVKNWQIGDYVDWRGPYDTEHVFNFRKIPALLVVCSGTGLAPVPPILDALFSQDDAETWVRLVCCFRNVESVIFRDKMDEWAKHWNCKISVYFSENATAPGLPHLVEHHAERLTEANFEKEFEELEKLSKDIFVIVCGSLAFEKDVTNFAIRQAIPIERRIRFA